MFYDERIQAGRGKAFRNTMIFVVCYLFGFGICHAVGAIFWEVEWNVLTFATEGVGVLVGAVLLLYGAAAYGLRPLDEMAEARKNAYYARAFYWLLYAVAGCYCLVAPLRILAFPYVDYLNPNAALVMTELPAWLFLLLQFKRGELPINASFITENRRTYWKRVWVNVLKFGGICGIFTAIGFAVGLLCAAPKMSALKGAQLVSLLFAGLLTWISFSVEYLLISLAERSSDRAKERGTLSGMTLTFHWLALGIVMALSALTVILWKKYMQGGDSLLNLSKVYEIRTALSRISYYVSFYFGGLVYVYLLSELLPLREKALKRSLSAMVLIPIVSFGVNAAETILETGILHLDNGLWMFEIIAMVNSVSSLLFSVVITVFALIALCVLRRRGLIKTRHIVFMAIYYLRPFWERIIFTLVHEDVALYLDAPFALAYGVLFTLFFCRIKKHPLTEEPVKEIVG